jgi:hypothetical protein
LQAAGLAYAGLPVVAARHIAAAVPGTCRCMPEAGGGRCMIWLVVPFCALPACLIAL